MTNSSTSVDMPLGRRRFIGRLTAAMFLIVLLVAGAWLERAPLLRGIANVWIVSDPVTSADVVAVLGGGLEVRPFVAAEFYKKGLVPKVLVSEVLEAASSENRRHTGAQRAEPDGPAKAWGAGCCSRGIWACE
jgi:hypothetical protein